jgi:hypothetical protein
MSYQDMTEEELIRELAYAENMAKVVGEWLHRASEAGRAAELVNFKAGRVIQEFEGDEEGGEYTVLVVAAKEAHAAMKGAGLACEMAEKEHAEWKQLAETLEDAIDIKRGGKGIDRG